MSEPISNDRARMRQRLTGAERRDTILEAARREFARTGYYGASTASIARAAGCSEPMLYKHFAGKQALFAAVLRDATRTIEARFDEVIDGPGNLLDEWLSFVPLIMVDPDYLEMLQLRKLAITIIDQPEVHEVLLDFHERYMERVDRAISRAKAEGHVRTDVDSQRVAWSWAGLMLAGCYREGLETGGFAAMLPFVQLFVERLRVATP